ncbi:hypothetical protein [Glutamicibacter sp. JC586]|uniref:hypothetical protein n=1 Tax=Glutamicibacter sp. JC586 TaxID=2590552 RepID=UPI001358F66D|nr:hypothetical protein [Glutamicibacter sp. JC586]
MIQKLGRVGLGVSVLLVATFTLASCGSETEPNALSDQELAKVSSVVQDQGTVIDGASCQVEIFRIQGSTTYGWATCAPSDEADPQAGAQADSFPFRIEENKLSRPDEGANYQKDVDKLFPEDLRSAIKQHATGAAG